MKSACLHEVPTGTLGVTDYKSSNEKNQIEVATKINQQHFPREKVEYELKLFNLTIKL